jgi:hypothetical protein
MERFCTRGGIRRAVACLLIAALVVPAPSVVAAPAPTPLPVSEGEPGGSCADTLASGAYPSASTARSELWPPDHALLDVGLRVDVGEACLGRATTRVAVYSDEADDATGDGSTVYDAQLDPPDLYLRAERQGGGDGRVYLIAATAAYAGSGGRACVAVVVPKSQSKKHRDDALAQADAARASCETGGLPAGFQLLVEGALSEANQAPTVDAGPDQGIALGATAELDGSVSDDGLPAGGSLSVAWSVVTGPGSVGFADASSARTQASFGAAGTYLLRLGASDGQLSSFDDTQVVVQLANAAPVVDAGPDVSVTLPTTTATLQGTVTDDGRLVAAPVLSWTRVSGPAGVVFSLPGSATTEVTLPGEGVFELRLSAFDGQLTTSDDVRVTVSPEPPPSIDLADATVSEGDEGLTGASVDVTLSKPWREPVRVDYVTQDATAASPCDYARRYGTLEFAPARPPARCSCPWWATTPWRATRVSSF